MEKHLQWKDDKRKYANGEEGYLGGIRLFYVGWNVMIKENKENPYLLTTYLPQLKAGQRFKTSEEGYLYAEKLLKEYYDYLKSKMEK